MATALPTGNYAFIDGYNLHQTYENIGWKMDYRKLRNYLDKKYNVQVAYYFMGNIAANGTVYGTLTGYGYQLMYRDISPYTAEEEYCPYCLKCVAPELPKIKCDCDVDIALQIISDIKNYRKAILITSDGDFDNLVRELINQDKLRQVLAPCRAGCSALLKKAALGRIAFLDDYRKELEKT